MISRQHEKTMRVSGLSAEHRLKVREAWLANPDLLESFIAENPSNLSKDELAMVSAWRHQTGKFYEWSWTGNDEMDPVSGRGWAVLDGNKLQGIIALHHGDESRFEAEHKR
jgi:hypothetical protein